MACRNSIYRAGAGQAHGNGVKPQAWPGLRAGGSNRLFPMPHDNLKSHWQDVSTQLPGDFSNGASIDLGIVASDVRMMMTQDRPRGVQAKLPPDPSGRTMPQLVRMPGFQAMLFAGTADGVRH